MDIVMMDVSDLIPYENNPRRNDGAVDAVAASISEFGFKVPIIVDAEGVVVAGHTRLKAAKQLQMDQVPVIVADDLTEEQVDAFRLADNKVAELADWDYKKLEDELDKILDIDMEEFGFEFEDAEEQNWADTTQDKVENILGLGKGQFAGAGYYDIPIINGTTEIPEVEQWIGFNYMMSDPEPENKGLHFFVDDYQFERVWNYPEKYLEKLKRYKAVLSPDFSPYGDMPHACQIFNHYRKHWCAAYWQSNGVNVIPTIRASTDPRSMKWYLDGEPKNSVVAISTMWATNVPEDMEKEFKTMMKELTPCHVFVYGNILEYMDTNICTRIPTFTEGRFKTRKGMVQ